MGAAAGPVPATVGHSLAEISLEVIVVVAFVGAATWQYLTLNDLAYSTSCMVAISLGLGLNTYQD